MRLTFGARSCDTGHVRPRAVVALVLRAYGGGVPGRGGLGGHQPPHTLAACHGGLRRVHRGRANAWPKDLVVVGDEIANHQGAHGDGGGRGR